MRIYRGDGAAVSGSAMKGANSDAAVLWLPVWFLLRHL